MQKQALTALARHQLESARTTSSGRSAQIVYGDRERALRQTMVALHAGSNLAEHESPGEATVQVLHRRSALLAGLDPWNGSLGDLLFIPDSEHSLETVEDSVVLLAAAKRT